MPSKSDIKTKLINKVKYLSIFSTSYYMIKIPYGGEKTQNVLICKVGRYTEEYKDGEMSVYLVE